MRTALYARSGSLTISVARFVNRHLATDTVAEMLSAATAMPGGSLQIGAAAAGDPTHVQGAVPVAHAYGRIRTHRTQVEIRVLILMAALCTQHSEAPFHVHVWHTVPTAPTPSEAIRMRNRFSHLPHAHAQHASAKSRCLSKPVHEAIGAGCAGAVGTGGRSPGTLGPARGPAVPAAVPAAAAAVDGQGGSGAIAPAAAGRPPMNAAALCRSARNSGSCFARSVTFINCVRDVVRCFFSACCTAIRR